MKTILTLIALLWAAGLQAQTNETEPQTFAIVEDMPEYPGGESALLKYLMSVPYPNEAKEKQIEGKVMVKFIIDKTGEVTTAEIAKSSESTLLDSVSIAHVLQMPAWKPGQQNGKPVHVKYIVPLNFVLTDAAPAPQKKKRDN